MSTSHAFRGRVSRETRHLLAAALFALLALWVLARIRFPGVSPSPNPIPSLLSQLSLAPRFANLAGEIAELQGRLSTTWLTVAASGAEDIAEAGSRQLTAMRLQSNAAIVLIRTGDRLSNQDELVSTDRVTGLAIIRTREDIAPVGVPPWMPQSLNSPQYFMATVGTPSGVSLRPVLVASLHETHSPAWPGAIWSVPEGTDLTASSFVFTTSGEIAGLAVREPTGLAIVPWEVVREEATRILNGERTPAVDLRMEVRPLTAALIASDRCESGCRRRVGRFTRTCRPAHRRRRRHRVGERARDHAPARLGGCNQSSASRAGHHARAPSWQATGCAIHVAGSEQR